MSKGLGFMSTGLSCIDDKDFLRRLFLEQVDGRVTSYFESFLCRIDPVVF